MRDMRYDFEKVVSEIRKLKLEILDEIGEAPDNPPQEEVNGPLKKIRKLCEVHQLGPLPLLDALESTHHKLLELGHVALARELAEEYGIEP